MITGDLIERRSESISEGLRAFRETVIGAKTRDQRPSPKR
jgi:hypothetical protein